VTSRTQGQYRRAAGQRHARLLVLGHVGQRGFTLLEVLLSVAIISILVGLSLPLYRSLQTRSDLDATAQGIADALRRAQSYARSGNGDSVWGFSVQSGVGAFYMYKGASFASRDSAYDETFNLLSSSVISDTISGVTFGKLTGAPSAAGSLVLRNTNNETRTITLNAKGMVTY